MKGICLSLLMGLVMSTGTASADILIEPYLGYHTGKAKDDTPPDFTIKGTTLGARLGYKHFSGLMLGLDYMTGQWQDDDSPKTDYTPNYIGAFAGFELPILFRGYVSYNLTNDLKFDTGSSTGKIFGGSTMKVGLGFTFLPMVAVNLEYITSTFKKAEVGGLSGTTDSKLNQYGIVFSVPLSL